MPSYSKSFINFILGTNKPGMAIKFKWRSWKYVEINTLFFFYQGFSFFLDQKMNINLQSVQHFVLMKIHSQLKIVPLILTQFFFIHQWGRLFILTFLQWGKRGLMLKNNELELKKSIHNSLSFQGFTLILQFTKTLEKPRFFVKRVSLNNR